MYVHFILNHIYLRGTLARKAFPVFPQQRLASYCLTNISHFGTHCIPFLLSILQQIYELFIINYYFTDEVTDTGEKYWNQDLNP